MFAPDKVKVPAPALVNEPAPEITPEITSSPASPVVSVLALANTTAPAPDKLLMVSVA